nr:protein sidekick-2-like [Pogona vitticeps]
MAGTTNCLEITCCVIFALLGAPPVRAQDDVSPYFKTEPVRSQVHLEGNRLVLTCMAEGSWPLEFKWLHDNKELTKFSLEYRCFI